MAQKALDKSLYKTETTTSSVPTRRINVLIYEPYIFNVYGNTRYLLSIFRYYDKQRFNLLLCAPYEHPFLDMVRELGGQCLVVSAPEELSRYGGKISSDSFLGRLRTIRAILRNSNALKRVLKERKIEVVQCHSIRSLMTIGWCARFSRLPCFWYVKGDLANALLDRLGFFLASRIFFQSTRTRDRRYPILRRICSRKIGIIRNGIDLEETRPVSDDVSSRLRAELSIHSDRTNIVVLGQVSPLKGSDLVISALQKLKDEGANFHCYFVGDHVLEKFECFIEEINTRVKDGGLSPYVTFVGWRADAIQILSQMDLLVHASLSEGVPKAVIEAMSLRVPVIATDVGGTADLVQEGRTGRLIPAGDGGALLQSLRAMLSDKEKRLEMADAAYALVQEKYSVTENVRHLEHIYCELAPS